MLAARGYSRAITRCVYPSPATARGFVIGGVVSTKAELLEALHHHTATRARLAGQPGTHGQRASLLHRIDDILDQLREIDHDLDEYEDART